MEKLLVERNFLSLQWELDGLKVYAFGARKIF